MNKAVKVLIVLIPIIALAAWFWSQRAIEPEPIAGLPTEVAPDNIAAQGTLIRDDVTTNGQPEQLPKGQSRVPKTPIPVASQIDGSDTLVATALSQLSPTLLQWFTPEEQVRKWVLAVDLMADGDIPKHHRPIDFPMPSFAVQVKEGNWVQGQERYTADKRNEARLSTLLDIMVNIPPQTLASYYHAWLPLLDQAYQELGKAGAFSDRVKRTISNIQNVGPQPVDAELIRPHVFYSFSSPQLEQATPLQKAIWRLGDDNREKLQDYVNELKFYL